MGFTPNRHMDRKAVDASIAFLRRWYGNATRVITAIDADEGYIRTRGFGPAEDAGLRAFIEEWRGRRNLYFQVNADLRAAGAIDKKGRKEHIAAVVALQVDVDFYKTDGDRDVERERVLRLLTVDLPPSVPGQPSVINSSGNGVQAFWLLRTPVRTDGDLARVERVERYNRGLQVAFGGDAVTDVNRIMRLPWSINLPNRKKRDLGLVPVLARQISFDASLRYDLDQFPAVDGPAGGRVRAAIALKIGEAVGIASLDELPVSERTKTIIKHGAFPGEHREGGRSSWLFSAILSMIGHGVPDEAILGVITDPTWGISESVLEKPDPDAYGRRQITRAHASRADRPAHDFDALPANDLDFTSTLEPLDFDTPENPDE